MKKKRVTYDLLNSDFCSHILLAWIPYSTSLSFGKISTHFITLGGWWDPQIYFTSPSALDVLETRWFFYYVYLNFLGYEDRPHLLSCFLSFPVLFHSFSHRESLLLHFPLIVFYLKILKNMKSKNDM